MKPATALLLLMLVVLGVAPGTRGAERQLWLYYSTNLQVEKNVETLEAVWRRAAAAGYTHVLLADSKLAKLGDLGGMTDTYLANARRVRGTAEKLGLTIVPSVFHIGYSSAMLWHDPNLAEGMPVRGALFEVKGGVARVVGDPPAKWSARPGFVDGTVGWSPEYAKVENPAENARFMYGVKVSPFRCYHISVWIRTEGFTGSPRVAVLGGGGGGTGGSLNSAPLGVKGTQDWTEHHVVFNSLENRTVNVYFGQWGAARGKLEWRDWRVEEAGPVNVLRRAGAPVVVTEEGTGRVLVEGVDYEPIVDPKLGSVPWKGEYDIWHEPPAVKVKAADGTKLRISWFHPVVNEGNAVMVCPSEPKVVELLKDEAERVAELFGRGAFMMAHDEVRCLNWDDACAKRGMDAGAILADNVRTCTGLLPKEAKAYVWSDMFDPHHNAHAGYYLVRGDLKGAWEGLDPKRVTVMNWNFGKRSESLKFFADRGHHQVIAGYYDGAVGKVAEWMKAAESVPNVDGVMYTTWANRYEDLEAFARVVRGEDKARRH